jgi:hypothetical protein
MRERNVRVHDMQREPAAGLTISINSLTVPKKTSLVFPAAPPTCALGSVSLFLPHLFSAPPYLSATFLPAFKLSKFIIALNTKK